MCIKLSHCLSKKCWLCSNVHASKSRSSFRRTVSTCRSHVLRGTDCLQADWKQQGAFKPPAEVICQSNLLMKQKRSRIKFWLRLLALSLLYSCNEPITPSCWVSHVAPTAIIQVCWCQHGRKWRFFYRIPLHNRSSSLAVSLFGSLFLYIFISLMQFFISYLGCVQITPPTLYSRN